MIFRLKMLEKAACNSSNICISLFPQDIDSAVALVSFSQVRHMRLCTFSRRQFSNAHSLYIKALVTCVSRI